MRGLLELLHGLGDVFFRGFHGVALRLKDGALRVKDVVRGGQLLIRPGSGFR
jgi:hypothetical protein